VAEHGRLAGLFERMRFLGHDRDSKLPGDFNKSSAAKA
jgi:hypothetical protein